MPLLESVGKIVRQRDVLVTIAFDDPEAIRWQALLIRHYVPRTIHINRWQFFGRNCGCAAAAVAGEGYCPIYPGT
jgi:hypothetical protein